MQTFRAFLNSTRNKSVIDILWNLSLIKSLFILRNNRKIDFL